MAIGPSLHAAMAWLSFLTVRRISQRWSLLVLVWGGLVWFAIVYLWEHYLLDAVGGVASASRAWAAVRRLGSAWASRPGGRRLLAGRG